MRWFVGDGLDSCLKVMGAQGALGAPLVDDIGLPPKGYISNRPVGMSGLWQTNVKRVIGQGATLVWQMPMKRFQCCSGFLA